MEIIGVDAGATWIKAGRFSADLKLLQETKVASGASQGKEEYFSSIKEVIQRLTRSSVATNLSLLRRDDIGIGLPGVFSKDGQMLLYTANVKGLGVESNGMSIEEMKKQIGVEKLTAANDAECAALAEWAQGAGQGDTNIRLLHITLGTGIGTGLIVAGKIQYGWEGGHMLAAAGLELEHSKNITDVAQALANMAVIGYPDIVTLGGGLATPELIDQIKQAEAVLPSAFIRRVLPPDKIQLGQLGNSAGMIGAAML